jgi:hypothetical protein
LVFLGDEAGERGQPAEKAQHSDKTNGPVTHGPGKEEGAQTSTGTTSAQTPRRVQLLIGLIPGDPILSPHSAGACRRLWIKLGGALNRTAELVDPLAGSNFRAVGVHAFIDGSKVRWVTPVHHLRKPHVEVHATIRPIGVVADQPQRAVQPPRGSDESRRADSDRPIFAFGHGLIVTRLLPDRKQLIRWNRVSDSSSWLPSHAKDFLSGSSGWKVRQAEPAPLACLTARRPG